MKRLNTNSSIVDTGLVTSAAFTGGLYTAAFTLFRISLAFTLFRTSLLFSVVRAIAQKTSKTFIENGNKSTMQLSYLLQES